MLYVWNEAYSGEKENSGYLLSNCPFVGESPYPGELLGRT